jgi:hypothetical protein
VRVAAVLLWVSLAVLAVAAAILVDGWVGPVVSALRELGRCRCERGP